MTEQILAWKKVLDEPINHYLECDIPDSDREIIQQTYDQMFQKIIEKEKLLNLYRKDHQLMKDSHAHLIEEVKSYKKMLGEAV